jgi:hypothetical protein
LREEPGQQPRFPAVGQVSGGAEEDRTPDLRIANATLSQLSYGPTRSTECTPDGPEKSTLPGRSDGFGKTDPAKPSRKQQRIGAIARIGYSSGATVIRKPSSSSVIAI